MRTFFQKSSFPQLFLSALLVLQLAVSAAVPLGVSVTHAQTGNPDPSNNITQSFPANPTPGTTSTITGIGNICMGTNTQCLGALVFENVPDGTYTVDFSILRTDGVVGGAPGECAIPGDPQNEEVRAVTVNPANPFVPVQTLITQPDPLFAAGQCQADEVENVAGLGPFTVDVDGSNNNTVMVYGPDNGDIYSVDANAVLRFEGPLGSANLDLGKNVRLAGTSTPLNPTDVVPAGSQIIYNFNYHNTGTQVANGVTMVDDFDEQYINTIDDVNCQVDPQGTVNAGDVTYNIGDVDPGEQVFCEITATLHDEAGLAANGVPAGQSTVLNTVSINSSNAGSDTAQAAFLVDTQQTPGLTVTKDALYADGAGPVNTDILPAGAPYYYSITATNNGSVPITDLDINDQFDSFFYLADNFNPFDANSIVFTGIDYDTNTVQWDINQTLNPGESVTVEYSVFLKDQLLDDITGTKAINNTATATGTANGNPISGQATETVSAAFTADPYITKDVQIYGADRQPVTRTDAIAGDYLTYTINYGNTGNAVAPFSQVEDTITNASLYTIDYVSEGGEITDIASTPAQDAKKRVLWNPVGVNNGNCLPGGQGCGEPAPTLSAECSARADLGCVAEAGTKTIILKVNDTLPDGTTVINNTANILYFFTETGSQQVESDFVNTPVSSFEGCLVTKDVDKAVADPGEVVTYTINYVNQSQTSACTSAELRDFHDQQNQNLTTIIPGSISDGGVLSNDGSTDVITWSLGTINPGQNGTVSFQATIDSNFPVSTTDLTQNDIYNRARLDTAEEPGGILSNDVVTRVGGGSVLQIVKAVNRTVAEPGDDIVYTLNVTNLGDAEATNVQVFDPFTNENQNFLTYVSASPEREVSNGDENIFNLGTLGAGESREITVTASISDNVPANNGGTRIVDLAVVDSNENDPAVSNEVATVVNPLVVLEINKSVSTTEPLRPNDTFEYVLQYENTGKANGTNLVVRDIFSNTNQDKISFVSASPAPDPGTTDRWSLGTLAAGASGEIRITARINNSIPEGQTIIDNVASAETTETGELPSNEVQVVALFTPPADNPPSPTPPGEVPPTTGGGIVIAIGSAIALGIAASVLYVLYRQRNPKMVQRKDQ